MNMHPELPWCVRFIEGWSDNQIVFIYFVYFFIVMKWFELDRYQIGQSTTSSSIETSDLIQFYGPVTVIIIELHVSVFSGVFYNTPNPNHLLDAFQQHSSLVPQYNFSCYIQQAESFHFLSIYKFNVVEPSDIIFICNYAFDLFIFIK